MSGSPVPQVPDDTVRAIFRTFDRQTRRQRSILRLALVALMEAERAQPNALTVTV